MPTIDFTVIRKTVTSFLLNSLYSLFNGIYALLNRGFYSFLKLKLKDKVLLLCTLTAALLLFYLRCITLISRTNMERLSAEMCVLPKYDPYDQDLIEHIDLARGDWQCQTEFKLLTDLKNGKVETFSLAHYCEGRCLNRGSDYRNRPGEWQPLDNTTFKCDIVETKCSNVLDRETTYGMLHTQVYQDPKNESSEEPDEPSGPSQIENKRYNVFVILVDSMGASQAHRNFPKTMRFLELSRKAVVFPYVNKVGRNTRPNAMALWFGKQIEPIERDIFGMPNIEEDMNWDTSCKTLFDNETVLFDEYTDVGYKTFLADDWAKTALNYPDCYGMRRQMVDHLMQPFLIAIEYDAPYYLKQTYKQENCKFKYKDVFNFNQQFIDAYKDQLMFSWIWSNTLSHDVASDSMMMDTDILKYLVENREILDNSFVFLMSDHGFRFGDVAQSKLGGLDANNPMLIIAPPKDLKNSRLREQLAKNALQLQTHYDTRATLLDIVRYQPEANFDDITSMKVAGERGQSLFRKQTGERSCRTLPITYGYCICEMPTQTLDVKDEYMISIGKAVINFVNDMLYEHKLTNLCELWIFSEVYEAKKVEIPGSAFETYTLILGVSKPYKHAIFETSVRVARDETVTVNQVDRLDAYENRGSCAPYLMEMFCDCREQTRKKKTK